MNIVKYSDIYLLVQGKLHCHGNRFSFINHLGRIWCKDMDGYAIMQKKEDACSNTKHDMTADQFVSLPHLNIL